MPSHAHHHQLCAIDDMMHHCNALAAPLGLRRVLHWLSGCHAQDEDRAPRQSMHLAWRARSLQGTHSKLCHCKCTSGKSQWDVIGQRHSSAYVTFMYQGSVSV